MSPLVLGEILGVFVHTLAADGKYAFPGCEICNSQPKCNYLRNTKLVLQFFFYFWKLHQTLNSLKKMNIVKGNVFPKLQNVKNLVRPLSKKRRFRTCLHSQHVKTSKVHAKSP